MLEAIVLGVVQGLTEYIPVSSTAHLILAAKLFGTGGIADTLSFDIALHAGTLIAAVVYFRRDWAAMLTTDRRTLALVVLGTVPAGAAGFLLNHVAETHLRSPLLIALVLIAFSFVMLAAERCRKERPLGALTAADALLIGAAQALAIVPGVSRSGITISAGLFRDLTRESAARFSFLLSTPLIASATLLHLVKIARHGGEFDPGIVAAGVVSSAVAGFLAIGFLMRFFRRHPMHVFVYYRIILGIVIVGVLWLKG